MKYEFHLDPETGEPHLATHGVSEQEALDVLEEAELVLKGSGETMVAHGQTRDGRWLRVVYVERPPGNLRIITAYTPGPKAIRAIRRRVRKKP
ncbi:MAG: DUF4258 domain-containing protein [Dehalococcoidia bacterium]